MPQTFTKIADIRSAIADCKQHKQTIVIVPTMGNLHNGHLQLIDTAKQHGDVVIATIFVNSMQFGLNEDWEQYPRTAGEDIAKLQTKDCDWVFLPTHAEMYPNGIKSQTLITEPTMSKILCGASRPVHFDGVTTVLTKLINITTPDYLVLGSKDYQQLQITRKMLQDVCSSVKVIASPIAREADGLAYSSRNMFLSSYERTHANILNRALLTTKDKVSRGRRDLRNIENEAIDQITDTGFRVDYFQICRPDSLQVATSINTKLIALGAMYADHTRLIDNMHLL